jgi:hypothetical protein
VCSAVDLVIHQVQIGAKRFRLRVEPRGTVWLATAEDADRGDRFGPEITAESEARALEALERWLDWQHEHIEALEALQRAERSYHRAVAGDAFSAPDQRSGDAARLLDDVDRARLRLDAVRARQPR